MESHTHRAMNPSIAAFFDRHAKNWEKSICPEHQPRLSHTVAACDIRPGMRVLDVGAGNGVLIPLLRQKIGPSGALIAIDLSPAMLREFPRERIRQAHRVQADILDPPFPAAAFDWVCCNSVFPHFVDQTGVVKALAALLKRGGRLLICHSQSRAAINAYHQQVGDIVGGHELPEKAAMIQLIENAGLRLETYIDEAQRYTVEAIKG